MKWWIMALCAGMLGGCQALTGLEKLRAGSAGSTGESGQQGLADLAANGGAGSQGSAGTSLLAAVGGMHSLPSEAGTSGVVNMSMLPDANQSTAGTPAGNHTSVKPGDAGGQSMPPAAQGGMDATVIPVVPSSGPPSDNGGMDTMDPAPPEIAGKEAPPIVGGDAPKAGGDAPRGGRNAAQGGGGAGGTAGASPVDCTPPAIGGAKCDTSPQCGCPADQQCAFVSNRLACVRSGSSGPNQACSRASDCQIGLQCLGGACLKLCDPANSLCGDAPCIQFYNELNLPVPGGYICLSQCNLVDPRGFSSSFSACGAGMQCIWSGGGSYCSQSDHATRGHGEICSQSQDCKPGFMCTGQHTCAKWCMSSSDCPNNFHCENAVNARVNGTQFGLCEPSCGEAELTSCTVEPQCGCASGQACDFEPDSTNNHVRACRAGGRTQAYNVCSGATDCVAGTSCVANVCMPFCNSDQECGGGYAECSQIYSTLTPGEPPINGMKACIRPCDPADRYTTHGPYVGCTSGRNCVPSTDGHSVCVDATEQVPVGGACKSDTDCSVGQVCVGQRACYNLCRNDADCSAGVCTSFTTRNYAADVEWGFCN